MEARYDALARQCAEDSERAERRADAQDRAIDALRTEVAELEASISATKAKFFALLGYTRRIIAGLPAGHRLPPVPPELTEWLGHS